MHWKFSWEYEAIYLVAMSQLKKKKSTEEKQGLNYSIKDSALCIWDNGFKIILSQPQWWQNSWGCSLSHPGAAIRGMWRCFCAIRVLLGHPQPPDAGSIAASLWCLLLGIAEHHCKEPRFTGVSVTSHLVSPCALYQSLRTSSIYLLAFGNPDINLV